MFQNRRSLIRIGSRQTAHIAQNFMQEVAESELYVHIVEDVDAAALKICQINGYDAEELKRLNEDYE